MAWQTKAAVGVFGGAEADNVVAQSNYQHYPLAVLALCIQSKLDRPHEMSPNQVARTYTPLSIMI